MGKFLGVAAALLILASVAFGQNGVYFPAVVTGTPVSPDVVWDAANSAGVASPSTNFGITWTVGNLSNRAAAITIVWFNAVTVTSVTGAGATWNLVSNSSTNYSTHYTATYACVGPTAGSQTVNVVFSGSVDGGGGAVVSAYNVDQSTPVVNATASGNWSATVAPTASVTTSAGGLLVGVVGWWDGSTCTPDQGTERTECTTPSGAEFSTLWTNSQSSNPQTMSAVLGTAQNYTMVGYMFKKAP